MSKASKAMKDRAATKYPKDPIAQRRRHQMNWRRWRQCDIKDLMFPRRDYYMEERPGFAVFNMRSVLQTNYGGSNGS